MIPVIAILLVSAIGCGILLLAYFRPVHPRRRRARCSCKHVWRLHSARGCAGRYAIPCECKLNRLGKPIRPVAVVRSA